jgi:hypothetical protein
VQVVHDDVATRSMLFGEHPAQEGECARRRACYINGIDSLVAEEDLITASSHMQRALQVRGCCRSSWHTCDAAESQCGNPSTPTEHSARRTLCCSLVPYESVAR